MDYKVITEKWQAMVSEIDSLPTENIYTLLNPEDKKRFFELVEYISSNNLFKLDHNGVPDSKLVKAFKMLAVQYLIEFEKDNKRSTSPTNPVSIPYIPVAPDPSENLWQFQHGVPYVPYCTIYSSRS